MAKNSDVDAWLATYDNPMKPVVSRIRDRVLKACPEVEEAIKWQAPTFIYKGNIASFFPKAKKHASLMFHKGAEIPGIFPNLVGDGKEARQMKFADPSDFAAKRSELESVVKAWIAAKDA